MKSILKRKLKFLYLSADKYPPFLSDVAVLFGKELPRRGHRIDFIFQSKAETKKNYDTKWLGSRAFIGATNNGTGKVNRFHKHFLGIINDLRLFKLTKKERYDFIQVKDKFITAFIAILVSKITKRKFFFWLSYPFPEADIYEYYGGTARYPYLYLVRGMILKLFLYSFILPLSDHVFVQSQQMKKDIIQQGIYPDKMTPVPMGIDLDDYLIFQGLTKNPIERDPNAIIYLGTMQKVRRIDFVIRVFRKVLDIIPEARLYMVGDSENTEDLDFLKAEAKRLEVDHATVFTGNLPREKALTFVKRSAIGISPYFPTPILNSTSPTKLIEYMSLGIPVVANDHPEQRRLIGESKAGFCVQYNEDAFATAIIELLEEPEKSKEMGNMGKEYILKKRNYKVIADLVENKYYNSLR